MNRRIKRTALATAVAAVFAGVPMHSAMAATCTWIPATGNWGTVGNWSCGNVPGAADTAVIGAGLAASLSSGQVFGPSVVNNAGTVNITNNSRLNISGTNTNTGTINLQSVGNLTDLGINGIVALNGAGTVSMGNNVNNRIVGDGAGPNSLTIGAGQTIQGAGSIGAGGALGMVNNGSIIANLSSGINLSTTSAVTNNSVMRGDAAALTISNTAITQGASGVLNAINAGAVVLSNASITGGSFTTASGGVITTTNGTFANNLSGVTNQGTLNIINNSGIVLNGTLTNNGTVNVQSVGNFTDIRINGAQTINGTGTIAMSNTQANRIAGNGSGDTLTLGSGQTITGAGTIGAGSTNFGFVNQGTVIASQSAGLLINASAGVTNTGTLRADGATLLLQTTINSSGGSIQAVNGSQVQLLNGAVINNANFSASGGGLITTANGATVTLGGGTVNGPVNVTNNSFLQVTNDVTYNGTLSLSSVGNFTDLSFSGARTLSGTATVQMSNTAANRINSVNGGGDSLTTGANITIQGSGVIGGNNLAFTNGGTVIATQGTPLLIQSAVPVTNSGVMRADGGTLQIQATINSAGGSIEARNGSQVQLLNGTVISNANFSATGLGSLITTVNGASVALAGGSLNGPLDVTNNSFLRLDGNVSANGSINVNSVGNFTDIQVNGNRSLSGPLSINMSNSSANRIVGFNASGDTLTLANNVTVQGAGQIGGGGTLNVVNNGLIVGNQSNNIGISTSGSFTNNATIRGDGNAVVISGTAITQSASGVLNAINSGAVVLTTNTNISGGSLTTASGGVITTANGNAARLTNVTNSGTVNVVNNSFLELAGTLTNNGAVNVQSVGNFTDLRVTGGAVSIGGTGTINFSNTTANRLIALAGTDSLTLGSGQTLQGAGQIGAGGQFNFTNNGTVVANASSGMTIDSSGTLLNNNIIRADAANLTINSASTNLTQSGTGVIQALNGGSVTLTGNATITGGTLNTAGGGVIQTANGNVSNIANLTNNGTFNVVNNSILTLTGTITNNGALNVNSVGNFTDLRLNGNVTLGGTGTTTLSNASVNRIIASTPGDTLTVGAGQTVQGSGQIGALGSMNLVNQGTITANQPNALNIQVGVGNTVTNQAGGLMQSNTNGTLNLGTTVANNGAIAANGGVVNATAGFTGTGTAATSGLGILNLGAASTVGTIQNNGSSTSALNLGANNITVSSDYQNANFGTGNGFNARQNVAGTGLILAAGTPANAQVITGANVTNGGTTTPTLTIGNVRVGSNTLSYDVANNNTGGPAIRGAIQTTVSGANISDARLSGSGVTAGNFGPVAAGSSQTFSVNFNAASAGVLAPMAGQVVRVANNFDNVAEQNISIQLASGAAAYNAAVGNTGAATVANQHVGGSNSAALTVNNTAPAGNFTEVLNASFGANGGQATNNGASITGGLGTGGIAGGGANNATMRVGVDTTTAGAKSGTVTLNYVTNGLGTSGLAPASAGSQLVNVTGNVYRLAQANTIGPINFGNVLAGSTQTRTVSISNQAAADGFSEALNAAFGTIGGTNASSFGTSGAITGLLAGNTDNATMVVTLNTSSTGAKTANVQILLASNGTAIGNGLGITALPTQVINLDGVITGTVGNLASAGLSPTTVNFGRFREGQVASQTQQLTVSNLTVGPGEGLNASFGANAGTASNNGGSIANLATGTSNNTSMSVTLNGLATAGAKSGSTTLNFQSDGSFNSGVPTTLPSQTVSMSAEVYRLAQAGLPAAVNLAARRVGDAAATGTLGIANTAAADGFSEGLKGTIGAAPTGFTVSGPATTALIAAGGSEARTVSLSTATAGNFSGNVNVALVSNGTGTSGFGDLSIGSANVAVSGKVYSPAVGQVTSPTTINFGTVRVGTAVTAQDVTIKNNAAGTALNDTLAGTLAVSGAGFTGNGASVAGLGAQVSNGAGTLQVGFNTSTAGVKSGTAQVAFKSQNPDMADLNLTSSGPITLSGTVNALANPVFSKSAGAGLFSGSGTSYTLDFGNLILGSGITMGELSLANLVGGPADDLLGSFSLVNLGAFAGSGFGSVNLIPNASLNGLDLSFTASSLGLFNGSFTFGGFSHNAFQSDLALGTITVTLLANVIQQGGGTVPEPGTLALLLAGLAGIAMTAKRRRNVIH